MQEELNEEWMDDYENSYSKYKNEWDNHYVKVRKFILSSMPSAISTWAFIGVTSTIPEISADMLESVEKLVLIDIYRNGMNKARRNLSKNFNFSSIELKVGDITHGFLDNVLMEFRSYDDGLFEKDYLFKALQRVSQPDIFYKEPKYDFITHLGIMDYYLMPIFSTYCEKFLEDYDEFFSIMRKLNEKAVNTSLLLLYQMLTETGNLVVSTPVSRSPIGEKCKVSLFWEKTMEEHVENVGFQIINKSEHTWNEFPENNGHSHKVLNLLCRKY